MKLESNESEEEFENSKPHLGALTHDDGPVDYEPLFGINPALDFQSEEDEIFDNVNQKPDEIFLQEGKSEPEPIGEPVATPRGELLEQPFEEPQFDSWPETQELPMSPDPDDVDSLPPQRPSKPALSSEDFLPPKEYPVEMEGELSEPTFIPESEIEDRMPFQSEVDMPWDFNNEAAGMGDEQKLSLDEIEEADEAYEATLPHHETDTVAKEIEQLLENPVMPKENTAILGLFQELKRLCEYLPQEEKNGFNSSMKALQMEYIISKLSGKPGLMELAENIREKGLVEVPAERYDIVERFDELAASARIMNVMRPFVQQLPDKNNSSLLDDSLQHLLDRLSKI